MAWESIIFTKSFHEVNQDKNKKIVKLVNDSLIDLRNIVKEKEILENENTDKVISIGASFVFFELSSHRYGIGSFATQNINS